VAARLDIGVTPRARLRRLSVVFAVELRLKIVAELYRREMSPPQFFEEFGGGSISRVNQNFERLVETGWLRYVRSEGPGGKRHGAVEHFYRSTEPAFFDAQTWALVPYSMRVASSLNLFNQIALRLRQVLEASNVDGGRKRDLSYTAVLLDQVGWERVIEAVNAQFLRIFEEQEASRTRVTDSGEELIQADVLMIGFESPMQGSRNEPGLVESDQDLMIHFPARLAPFLGDDLCSEILSELSRREMSATQFHREHGGDSLSAVHRRFKRLKTAGWLKGVNAKTGGQRRGATEQFYRATRPAINSDVWTNPPDTLRGTRSWKTFERFSKKVQEAMSAGTFDARTDRYVALSFLSLDQRGWTNVVAGIEELSAILMEEQVRAKVRIAKSGEKPIRMTVALGAFESPGDSSKAH